MTPKANTIEWGSVAAVGLGVTTLVIVLVLLMRIERELRLARQGRESRQK